VILLVDLDNTLIDRDLAFRTWAQHFINEISADPEDLDWLLAADNDGYTPRADLAVALKERWGLNSGVPDLVHRMSPSSCNLFRPTPESLPRWRSSRRQA
jgi:putative hydrolase of the HAD superfamily